MFRKTARIDVSIDESKDLKECRDRYGIFTVNVKLISGEFVYLFRFQISFHHTTGDDAENVAAGALSIV